MNPNERTSTNPDGVKGLRKIDGKPHCGCAAGPECKATWCTRGVGGTDA